jgi:mRNA deadenylase 3'-5' endonuclease subunit Ccr4
MYLPPLSTDQEIFATWDYRKSLLRDRIGLIDADVVCLQEVSPLSFETDFAFMNDELGYDGVELFKKGRFRPATFWKKDRVALAIPPQHKDRTMLTSFRLLDGGSSTQTNDDEYWHVLNCHLQAGKQGGRRVRQMVEGITTSFKTAKNMLKGTRGAELSFLTLRSLFDVDSLCVHLFLTNDRERSRKSEADSLW